MNLEENYRKAQHNGTFELYGFFVSDFKKLDEVERRTINLRYQIVELLVFDYLHNLEEEKNIKILVNKEEFSNSSLLKRNPVTFNNTLYLAIHAGTISEQDILNFMHRSFQDTRIFHPIEFMHCKYETNQEYNWNQAFTRNRAISLFDNVQSEGSPKYIVKKTLS